MSDGDVIRCERCYTVLAWRFRNYIELKGKRMPTVRIYGDASLICTKRIDGRQVCGRVYEYTGVSND